MKITIEATKIEAVALKLNEISDHATDFSPIGRDLSDIMRDDLSHRFASTPSTVVGGEVYGGASWSRLTDASFALDPTRRGGKIGVNTGQLRRQATVDGSGNLYRVDGTEFTFELTSERATSFQEKRQLVFWHPELLKRVSTRISQHLLEGMSNNRGG